LIGCGKFIETLHVILVPKEELEILSGVFMILEIIKELALGEWLLKY
jgi:hypothetical protein